MAGGKSEYLIPRILLDSDVIFDFVSARLPFYHDSLKIFTLAENKLVEVYTLPHLLINVWQIRGQMKIKSKAMIKSIGRLLTFMVILDEPATAVVKAANIARPDFEDSVTIECAVSGGLDYIITRNLKHFKESPIIALTPTEFVNKNFPNVV